MRHACEIWLGLNASENVFFAWLSFILWSSTCLTAAKSAFTYGSPFSKLCRQATCTSAALGVQRPTKKYVRCRHFFSLVFGQACWRWHKTHAFNKLRSNATRCQQKLQSPSLCHRHSRFGEKLISQVGIYGHPLGHFIGFSAVGSRYSLSNRSLVSLNTTSHRMQAPAGTRELLLHQQLLLLMSMRFCCLF